MENSNSRLARGRPVGGTDIDRAGARQCAGERRRRGGTVGPGAPRQFALQFATQLGPGHGACLVGPLGCSGKRLSSAPSRARLPSGQVSPPPRPAFVSAGRLSIEPGSAGRALASLLLSLRPETVRDCALTRRRLPTHTHMHCLLALAPRKPRCATCSERLEAVAVCGHLVY